MFCEFVSFFLFCEFVSFFLFYECTVPLPVPQLIPVRYFFYLFFIKSLVLL